MDCILQKWLAFHKNNYVITQIFTWKCFTVGGGGVTPYTHTPPSRYVPDHISQGGKNNRQTIFNDLHWCQFNTWRFIRWHEQSYFLNIVTRNPSEVKLFSIWTLILEVIPFPKWAFLNIIWLFLKHKLSEQFQIIYKYYTSLQQKRLIN
jgi:hypothetical protein